MNDTEKKYRQLGKEISEIHEFLDATGKSVDQQIICVFIDKLARLYKERYQLRNLLETYHV